MTADARCLRETRWIPIGDSKGHCTPPISGNEVRFGSLLSILPQLLG